MWILGVGPCTAWLAFQSAGTADVVGGLLNFKDVCRAMNVVALIIVIAVPACNVHSYTISFDI